ncbi:MAG TPA: tRNA (guanosine(46)-N7)-methyltransferase TrmB [Opitutaceae bacterium]|nr:tRNA (guanosine(46)-N7)-methyltransferase TrmB [Opitutaceae bacterium]
MDNPDRTVQHLERMAFRRASLRDALKTILPVGTPPFVWEVGCGHGHFLAAYAQAHPGELCVGIDVIRERIVRADRKRERARLANLHFVRAEAGMFLETLPETAAFSAIYILFSDPWPKQRHHKHRLMQPDFLTAAAARSGQGTRLYFRTDHEPYFVEAMDMLKNHPSWRLMDEVWPFEAATVFQQRAPTHQSLVASRR